MNTSDDWEEFYEIAIPETHDGQLLQPVRRFCWICGKQVSLEVCKTDELGLCVHEECYVARIVLNAAHYDHQPTRRFGRNRP